MDQVPSSKHSPDEVSASKRSPIHENVGYVADAVAEDHAENKGTDDSNDRVAALTRVETEKRLALIKAWEDNEKTKAENKAYKKLSAIGAQENTKRALVEVQLKQIEEEIEKEKAEKVEKIKNKIATLHQKAEVKRAAVEAKRGEDILKAEAAGAKHRQNGTTPTKFRRCFWC
ncbi:remorin-like isoform X1 [Apium graveolens]|uniref:remorin-like isoform X1 n=1 Tax=Apium graveolens TaxID=4045 RepID=UPI003D790E4E